jgi:hypothetical protein
LDIGPGRRLFVLSKMITEAKKKGYSERRLLKRSLKHPVDFTAFTSFCSPFLIFG